MGISRNLRPKPEKMDGSIPLYLALEPMSDSLLNLFHPGARALDTSAIRRVFQLAASLERPVNLSIGQPHFPPPEPIIEALEKAAREQKTAYTLTQGIPQLRERLYRKYTEKNNIKTNPDNILVTAGVSACLQLIFSSMLRPGDRVLLIEPWFLIYKSMIEFYGAEFDSIPETFTADDLAALNPGDYKFIIYSNPSNPSGYVFSDSQLELLANFAGRAGTLIVSDEIYEEFDYDGGFQSMGARYENTLTLTGFSKSYSMTGLRLAAMTGPPELIKKFITVQQYTVVCAPSVVQWAGIAALDCDLSDRVKEYATKRDQVEAALEPFRQKGTISYHRPGGAFYLYFALPEKTRALAFVERAIAEKSILLVPGDIFCRSENFIRLSYACEDAILEEGLSGLGDLLEHV